MNMADRIKERRTSMNYTQEELAQKLGLQKSAIAKYENGRVVNQTFYYRANGRNT